MRRPDAAAWPGPRLIDDSADRSAVGRVAARTPAAGVDRADPTSQRVELVEQGNDRFLVRDGDVGAEDLMVAADIRDGGRQAGASHLANQVVAIDLQRLEGGVLHRGREAPRNGVAQEEDG